MANETIRKSAKTAGVPLWKVAHKLNISEPTMTRKLRLELPEDEQRRIISIIDEIAAGKEAET